MRLRIFESPSLLEIAPAAFNMRYLQEVVQRAPFLHSISSVLARLIDDAQSSSLRQKVASLVMGTAKASGMRTRPANSTQEPRFTDKHDCVEGIGKTMWPVLQTGPSNTKLYLEKLPEDRVSIGTNVDPQLDRDSNHIHNLPQQSEMEGLPSGEQVNNKLEADDAQLGLHLVVHDMNDPDSSDLRHHLYEPLQSPGSTQEPEGAPSLNEDQRLGNNSQEHMQKYNSHVPKYQQTWQAFEQDDFFGDNYDTDQYIDDEEGTVGYYNAGHYSWVPDTDNEIANPYLGSGNDYEPEAEGCPYFSSSFAPPPVLENEAGILEDCFEDEPQKTDITSSQDSGSENLEQLGGYDQVFVDELGDQYVYEESHMLGNDGQYTVDNGALSSDLTPWEWDGGQRDDVDVDSWNQTQISLWAVRT
ncbi:hypothetical protein ACKVWE_000921 [Pyricularia oryzae]